MWHFHLGIGNGTSNPGGFLCSAFTCWQTKHLWTNLKISIFIPSHQKLWRWSCYIFVLPGWAVYGVQWASCIIFSFISATSGTHNLHLNLNTLSSIWNSLSSPSYTFFIIFLICVSLCWASLILSYKSNWILTWFNWYLALDGSMTHTSICISSRSLNYLVWWVIKVATAPDFRLKASATTLAFLGWYWIVISSFYISSSHLFCLISSSFCVKMYFKLLWSVKISQDTSYK